MKRLWLTLFFSFCLPILVQAHEPADGGSKKIEKMPIHVEISYCMGLIYPHHDSLEEGIEEFNKMILNNANDTTALYCQGIFYEQKYV